MLDDVIDKSYEGKDEIFCLTTFVFTITQAFLPSSRALAFTFFFAKKVNKKTPRYAYCYGS